MGPIPLTVTPERAAILICNLFPNLEPCDSQFYFYPSLNHRAYVVCPGAIMFNVGWEEELEAPQQKSDHGKQQVHLLWPNSPSCLCAV